MNQLVRFPRSTRAAACVSGLEPAGANVSPRASNNEIVVAKAGGQVVQIQPLGQDIDTLKLSVEIETDRLRARRQTTDTAADRIGQGVDELPRLLEEVVANVVVSHQVAEQLVVAIEQQARRESIGPVDIAEVDPEALVL